MQSLLNSTQAHPTGFSIFPYRVVSTFQCTVIVPVVQIINSFEAIKNFRAKYFCSEVPDFICSRNEIFEHFNPGCSG